MCTNGEKIMSAFSTSSQMPFWTLAQDAMKVSLAAQVMNNTVGASLRSLASQGKEHCSAFVIL
jgi:chemotaxis protein CheY-P-specific phosphatase CheC